jgi:hypothetical protein
MLLLVSVLLIVPATFSQEPAPQTPEDAYTSRELIAWSQLQTPQPTPQPLPPRDAQVPQPEQPQDQQPKSPSESQKQQEPVQSYAGVILEDENRFFLNGSDGKSYLIEAVYDLRPYENQTVTLLGTRPASAKTIRVLNIETLR